MRKLIYAMTFWLNRFPAKDGVSTTLTPRAMITGQFIEFSKHCLLTFGEYIQTHEDGDNYTDSWTFKARVLRPTGKTQGGQYFLNIHTGRITTRFT